MRDQIALNKKIVGLTQSCEILVWPELRGSIGTKKIVPTVCLLLFRLVLGHINFTQNPRSKRSNQIEPTFRENRVS